MVTAEKKHGQIFMMAVPTNQMITVDQIDSHTAKERRKWKEK